jgi:hypothetical protein
MGRKAERDRFDQLPLFDQGGVGIGMDVTFRQKPKLGEQLAVVRQEDEVARPTPSGLHSIAVPSCCP